MSKAGERDYILFEREARSAGLADLYAAGERGESLRPLVEALAVALPDRFPHGYKVAVIAALPLGHPGIAIRIAHPVFPALWGPVPLRLPSKNPP